MISQTKKQELPIVAVNLAFTKKIGCRFGHGLKGLFRICCRIDEILTCMFCARIVRQIEPGKFEEIELPNSNRPETSRHWRGLN